MNSFLVNYDKSTVLPIILVPISRIASKLAVVERTGQVFSAYS